MRQVRWPSKDFLLELLQPLLLLNSTALFQIDDEKIVIQLLTKQSNTVVQRILYPQRDYNMAKSGPPSSSLFQHQFIVNLENWMHLVNGTRPKSVELFPVLSTSTSLTMPPPPPLESTTPVVYPPWLVSFKPIKTTTTTANNKRKDAEVAPHVAHVEWYLTPTQIFQRNHTNAAWQLLPTQEYDPSHHLYYTIQPTAGPLRSLRYQALSALHAELLELCIFHAKARLTVSNDNTFQWHSECRRLCTRYNLSTTEIERHVVLRLPEWLQEDLWSRHQYSLRDVRKTLDLIPEALAWQLLVGTNSLATQAAVSINGSAGSSGSAGSAAQEQDDAFVYGAKSGAVLKLMKLIEQQHPTWADRPDVLWDMAKVDDPNGDGHVYEPSQRHDPCLPVHRLKPNDFERVVNGRLSVMTWRGILVCNTDSLLQTNHPSLLTMSRILPYTDYCRDFGTPQTLAQEPNRVTRNGTEFAILEETFFFYCPEISGASRVPNQLMPVDMVDEGRATKRLKS